MSNAKLDGLGAGKAEMGGSTVAFTLGTVRAVFDRPHPRRECGIGLVKRVRQFLINAGQTQPAQPDREGDDGKSRRKGKPNRGGTGGHKSGEPKEQP